MDWIILIVAGLFETFGVTMINRLSVQRIFSTGLLIILGFGVSLILLSIALKTIPMGTGYAIWTGIGVIGSTFIGMIYFNESKNWKRLLCILVILLSAIGLKLIG
ncbi:multidrug efflux SMR transporter [Melissococcus sp. OM08-11BH]|uniref:DMT family transporter n=1 Tax=Melissococcus sp. OM08-11BH TaxID=2293110 RepID=UPI000E4CBF2E|nr:multidrug efflux SMR transporter [Melissococcus sp. OM08-11BH]RGI31096.1 QacE family quaternary ammonium compound efflux SMR transporter [Melissococcus sp. OM08-11BH]